MKNNSSTIILAGFSVVILLVITLLFVSLQQIRTSNNELQNNIRLKSQHAVWANDLQRISTNRSELMLKILQADDDFERDDFIQEFYLLGQSFMRTRNNLYTTAIDQKDHDDKAFLDKNSKLIYQVSQTQIETINLRTENRYREAHYLFMTKVLTLQQKNIHQLNKFSNLHIEDIKSISSNLSQQQNKSFTFILISGLTVIIFCILIAWLINRKLSNNMNEIKRTRDDLSESLLETKNTIYALNQHAIVSYSDTAGTITLINDKFCEISQYSHNELIGQQHNIINSGLHNKTFFKNMWATIKSGLTWQGEIRNQKKDGSYYWVATTIVPFLDDNDIPYQYIAIRTDITSQKNTEYILEKSLNKLAIESEKAKQSNILKESIVSTMTHELRTPLNSILGFSQLLLLEEESFSGQQLQNLNSIYKSGNVLLLKIDNIMLYSKLKSNKVKLRHNEFDLNTLMISIIDAIKLNTPELTITPTMLCNDSLFMIADTELFRKAITYVIENAVKFTKEGEISVDFKKLDKGDELPASDKIAEQDLILITICDTGIGIPDDKIGIIFNEFRQSDEKDNRRFGGIGIGLALSKNIISLHQGSIWLTSKVNKGTSVYITVPQALV